MGDRILGIENNKTLLGEIPKMPKIEGKGGYIAIVIIIIALSMMIYIIVLVKYSKADIVNNWGDNRCRLSIIPIAGYIKPIGKEKKIGLGGTLENFNYCIDTMSGSFVTILLKPFMILITESLHAVEGIIDIFKELHGKSLNVHFNIFGMFKGYFNRLKDVAHMLSYINLKIDSLKNKTKIILSVLIAYIIESVKQSLLMVNKVFEKILKPLIDVHTKMVMSIAAATITIAIGAISIITLTLMSWMGWPIPLIVALVTAAVTLVSTITINSIGIYAYNHLLGNLNVSHDSLEDMEKQLKDDGRCFTDTLIELNDGKTIMLSNVKVGDVLKNNNRVNGKMVFNICDSIEIYKINNIEVTGSHLIYHDSNWIRVSNLDSNTPNLKKQRKFVINLYCLITETNIIEINNLQFRDYQETSDIKTLSYVNYYVLNNVNSHIEIEDYGNRNKYTNYVKKYTEHTYQPCFTNNILKRIINKYKYKIDGYIQIENTDIQMYKYKGYILSGNIILYNEKDNVWKRVWDTEGAEKCEINDKILYNISLIEKCSNIIDLGKIKIRDYVESNDTNLNNRLDKILDEHLKQK